MNTSLDTVHDHMLDENRSAKDIINSVMSMVNRLTPTTHKEILSKLLDQIEPIDFVSLAHETAAQIKEDLEKLNPDSREAKQLRIQLDNLKINEKHYLVLSIEHILEVANNNQWGLCRQQDFIYLYNGCYWSMIEKEELQSFLGKAAEKMGVPKFSSRLCFFTDRLLKQFMAAAYLPSPESLSDKVRINLLNGTFEISERVQKLRQFDPKDFITYQLPFEYDIDAEAPIFKAYLEKCLPDVERQQVLADYMGYLFIQNGALKLEKALILYGSGANGKSVWNEIVSALLGNENVSSYPLDLLTDSSGYYRAKIANKLVNYASEIGGHLKTDYFKQMVSGEPLSARLPYGNPMIITKYGKLIFNANELPKEIEQSNAFFRRFLIIPFDITISEDEQDKELHKKIIDNELSGVFNWVLAGLTRLLIQRRFSPCHAANKALELYKVQSDSVKLFMAERNYQPSPGKYKLVKELYFDYRVYCNEDGMKPVNKTNFTKRMEALGVIMERRTIGSVAYVNVDIPEIETNQSAFVEGLPF